MIRQHKFFPEVPDYTILWQYMSLAKFLYLIRTGTLHFHRLDDYPDKKEGTMSVLDRKIFSLIPNTSAGEEYLQKEIKRHFINCWIKSPHELALMWDTFGKSGVAIRSTAGHIRQAMEDDKEHNVRMIEVRYINEKTESAQILGKELNMLYFPTTKRNYFMQESEVRLLYENTGDVSDEKGINFRVNLKELIQEVRVYPNAPKFFFDLINLEAKELRVPIEQSSI